MQKHILYILLLCGGLTACLKDTSWGNYQLPEATRTGANTVGFKLGQTVLVPAGWTRANNLSTDASSTRIYINLRCKSDRQNLNHTFKLEIRDSIYAGAIFKANNPCSSQLYQPNGSMCTSLSDEIKGKQFDGRNDHTFTLRVEHFERHVTSTRMVLGSQGDSVLQRNYKVICAGTFSGVLATIAGELVTISDGRFDLEGWETVDE